MLKHWTSPLWVALSSFTMASCDPAPMYDQGPTKTEAEALTGETFERKDACFARIGLEGYECAFIGKHPNGQRAVVVHAFVKKDERWIFVKNR